MPVIEINAIDFLVIVVLVTGLWIVIDRARERRKQSARDTAMQQLKELNDAYLERRDTVHFPPRDALPTLEEFRARAYRGPHS